MSQIKFLAVLVFLLCALVVGVLLQRPRPISAQGEIDGLDVVILMDNAFNESQMTSEPETVADAMTTAAQSMAQYLGERTLLQNPDEQHTFSVVRFENSSVDVLLESDVLPLTDEDTGQADTGVASQAIRPPGDVCTRCYSDFDAAFAEAEAQLAQTPGGNRQSIIIILTEEPFGGSAFPDSSITGPQLNRSMINSIENRLRQDLPGTDVYLYGMGINQARWNITIDEWSGIFSAAQVGRGSLISARQLDQILLDLVRRYLPQVGMTIEPGTFTLPAYQSNFSIIYFRSNPTDRAELIYEGDVPDYTWEPERSAGNLIETITVRNPVPGDWRVRLSDGRGGEARGQPNSLELTQQAARVEQRVLRNTTPTTTARVNEPLQIVWQVFGHNDTVIDYGIDAYRFNIGAAVNGDRTDYVVPLIFQQSGSFPGAYVGDFYGAVPGDYTVSTAHQVNGIRANNVTLDVAEIQLVVDYDRATQFENWHFSAQLSLARRSDAIVPPFGSDVMVTANMILDNDTTIPIPVTEFDPLTGIFTSESIFMPDDQPFTLEISARFIAYDNVLQSVPRRPRADAFSPDLIPDRGMVAFATDNPRLLDEVEIIYRPDAISATELESRFSPTVTAIVRETDEDSGTGSSAEWHIPMTLRLNTETNRSEYVAASFYASRAVRHQLLVSVSTIFQDRPLELINLDRQDTLVPRPVSVRRNSPLNAVQFVPWDIEFEILDGDEALTVPFTGDNVAITPELRIERNGELVDTVLLTNTERSIYRGLYTFIRSGDYTLDVNFSVEQSRFTADGETQRVSLPLVDSNANQDQSADENGSQNDNTDQGTPDVQVTSDEQITPDTRRLSVEVGKTASVLNVSEGGVARNAVPVLTTLDFTLDTPNIGTATLVSNYDASAVLILSLPDVPTAREWRIDMPYNASTERFEATFWAAQSGDYTITAEINADTRFGADALLTTDNILSRTLEVRPVEVRPDALVTPRLRETDTLTIRLRLFDGEAEFDAEAVQQLPRVTVGAVNNDTNESVYTAFALYDSELNLYTTTMGPFTDTGSYSINVDVTAVDSTGRIAALPLNSNNTALHFNVEEALNLIVAVAGEPMQYSTGWIPFVGEHPLEVSVRLDSLPKALFDASLLNDDLRRTEDPTVVFSSAPDTWFTVTVLPGDNEVINQDYEVSPPEVNGTTVTFSISGLANADDYRVRVALSDAIIAEYPFRIAPSTNEATLSVSYQTRLGWYVVVAGAGLLVLSTTSYGIFRYRVARRTSLPIGYLYLTDADDRVLWAYDLNNIRTNQFAIAGPQGWERALIDMISVISKPDLKYNDPKEQIRVQVVIRGTQHEALLLNLEHPVEPIGDNRFKVGRSANPVPIHTSDIELQRIKVND